MPAYRPLADRFWEKVQKTDTCWTWGGSRHYRGYGFIRSGRTNVLAHRVAWELTNGSIPENMLVCHTCDNTSCVNPEHLFLGSQSDNMRDMTAKGRGKPRGDRSTHCAHGHTWTEKNTYLPKAGGRICRECQRLHEMGRRRLQGL